MGLGSGVPIPSVIALAALQVGAREAEPIAELVRRAGLLRVEEGSRETEEVLAVRPPRLVLGEHLDRVLDDSGLLLFSYVCMII